MSDEVSARAGHKKRFGTYGIWGGFPQFSAEEVAEFERLGLGAIWLGGSPAHLRPVRKVLEATEHITVATGIVNIWNTDAATIAGEYRELEQDFPGRFYLGIGAGHPEATSDYTKPYAALNHYLDVLDAEGVPRDRRLLAALGPRVLRLAAERSLGAHPYLVPAAHSRVAREVLGPDALLAPEHKVVVDSDPVSARAVGRPPVDKPYLQLSNYTNNLRRLGYSDADIADGGSDALIDALVAHGDAAGVKVQIDEHLTSGADHVAIQVLGSSAPAEQLAAILGA
ncbi:TIGR03620 family F420-dependent LLM class oxidoreductase [Gordonia amarae]|mgnify:CR=1 FL=1|uniref:Luciferase-like domain-containing protein n=2 Tax=Gordonia amarae TaxID=36821 RepID=G7GQF1_9ACTN|nr:LLM class F420-dependent oxidoreductase [Gordonia amarae]MCS3880258.1 putative F420-dependent oxidoreductase [Gordonia amarae]QHN18611.1 TIGR03620 family F420-dependent LLM class oxidoreductase [Gordonia amarae]QHN23086.1 TIGR03620 family F420-dependent LLM class oxidoreductase [Gordonia amarae]QHN31987.1 TIGR03620 family F420-dependent LLM class oxidoreductase [Gordonia amarae]QHN40734.1 TIGR03620 family F420-dependent LLM class oxidoreductase [Gordonia amarae]